MTDLLVTGASGHFGQAVLRHLTETLKVPAERFTAASRKPDRLSAWASRGVTVVEADFDDPASLDAAFAGARRLLIVSTDSLDTPGKRLSQHRQAIAAADKAGVAHVVYTSMPEPAKALVLFAPDHAGSEEALANSSIRGWTVLRNNWYSENVLLALPQALAGGAWYTAAGKGKTAYIGRDDLALGAAVALSSDFSGKRTLTLSGGRGYTVDDVAALARNTTGRPLSVVQVPEDGLIQGMIAAGLPEPVARVFASFDTNTKQGHVDGDASDFRALTGREPKPFADWFAENRAAFAAKAA